MNLHALNDELLIKASSGGNTEAFGHLVRKYQSFVCAVTFSATGSVDKSEELAQDVFVLAWKNLEQLKNHTRFKSWLYAIAKNRIKRFYRRQQHDPVAHAYPLEEADAVKDPGSPPPETVISQEQQEFIWDTLNHIPMHYREPLVLFYREGKSIKQVAAFLELNVDTVKQRLSRARQMIKSNLASMLEQTLVDTRPKATFSAGVVAVIAAGGMLSKTASAAGTAHTGSGFISGLLHSTAAKITTAAATVVLIGAGTVGYVTSQAEEPFPTPIVRVLPTELDEGLVLYLSFDAVRESDTQTIITDESIKGNHGLLTGGKFVTGRLGQALKCRARNKSDGVIIKDHDSLDLDGVTIAAWIKTDRLDFQWGRILDKGWRTGYNLCIGGDEQALRWRDRVSFECALQPNTSKTPVTDGRWHFIVGSYDGRTSSLYIDGTLEARKQLKEPKPMQHTNTPIHIASLAVPEPPPHDVAFYDGLIDEVRLYNRILSEEEIQTLYHYQPYYED